MHLSDRVPEGSLNASIWLVERNCADAEGLCHSDRGPEIGQHLLEVRRRAEQRQIRIRKAAAPGVLEQRPIREAGPDVDAQAIPEEKDLPFLLIGNFVPAGQ